jgi:TrmH family RNA methyltransferase
MHPASSACSCATACSAKSPVCLTPTGVAAVIEIPAAPEGEIAGDALLLDAVQDAGNVGAILRTAAAAGVRNVLLGPGCAGAWTPRVLRAGQGAHFSHWQSASRSICWRPWRIGQATAIGTVAHGGKSLYELELGGPTVWLVGNEGAGCRRSSLAAAASCAPRFRLPTEPSR